MRNHAKVAPQFWTGRTGRAIRAEGKEAIIAAVYLMTCPSANMIGLYYLPLPTLCHETGIPLEGARKALQSLSEVGFAHYDETAEEVWVTKMAKFQIGPSLIKGDKRITGVVRLVEQYRNSRFISEFYDIYKEPFNLPAIIEINGLLRASEAPSKGLRSQEQEQEQEKEQDKRMPPIGGKSAIEESLSTEQSEEKFATPEWLMERWNNIPGVVQCKELVGSVLKSVSARIKEHPKQSWWEQFLTEEVEHSEYLRGLRVDWSASLDWICGPKNMSKIRSGKYRNRASKLGASVIVSCTNRIKDGGRSMRPCLKPVAEDQRGLPKPLCPSCVILKEAEHKRLSELGADV